MLKVARIPPSKSIPANMVERSGLCSARLTKEKAENVNEQHACKIGLKSVGEKRQRQVHKFLGCNQR